MNLYNHDVTVEGLSRPASTVTATSSLNNNDAMSVGTSRSNETGTSTSTRRQTIDEGDTSQPPRQEELHYHSRKPPAQERPSQKHVQQEEVEYLATICQETQPLVETQGPEQNEPKEQQEEKEPKTLIERNDSSDNHHPPKKSNKRPKGSKSLDDYQKGIEKERLRECSESNDNVDSSSGLPPPLQTPEVHPGAYRQRPTYDTDRLDHHSSAHDNLNDEFSRDASSKRMSSFATSSCHPDTPVLTATKVEDYNDEEKQHSKVPPALVVAEKDSCWKFLKRSKSAKIACIVLTLIAFGLIGAIVYVVAFLDKGGMHENLENGFYHRIGSPISGNEESEYGFSLSLNGDGSRLAVAGRHYIQVFELENSSDNQNNPTEWVQIGMDIFFDGDYDDHIQSSSSSLLDATTNEEKAKDLVRTPIVVDLSHDGTYLAIGWPFYSSIHDTSNNSFNNTTQQDTRGLVQCGRVDVYKYQESTKEWERIGNSLIGINHKDWFGASVSLSHDGTVLAIGNPGNNGHVMVYTLESDNSWIVRQGLDEILNHNPDEAQLLVGSVSLSGNGTIVAVSGLPVGALNDTAASSYVVQGDGSNNVVLQGAVARVFEWTGQPTTTDTTTTRSISEWKELGDGIQGILHDTAYVTAISADGSIFAISNYFVGSFAEASQQGKNNDALDARTFQRKQTEDDDTEEWTLLGGNLHPSIEGAKVGYFISLSDDGQRMGMGDPGQRAESTGSITGHIHVYSQSNDDFKTFSKYVQENDHDAGSMFHDDSVWNQIGKNKYGESPGDQFGYEVSISGDGQRLAVSAPYNRDEGFEKGRVYVYDIF